VSTLATIELLTFQTVGNQHGRFLSLFAQLCHGSTILRFFKNKTRVCLSRSYCGELEIKFALPQFQIHTKPRLKCEPLDLIADQSSPNEAAYPRFGRRTGRNFFTLRRGRAGNNTVRVCDWWISEGTLRGYVTSVWLVR
jgi:hypothetical protein